MKTICLYFEIHQIIHLKRYRFFDIGTDHYYYDDYENERSITDIAERSYMPALNTLQQMIQENGKSFKVAFSFLEQVLSSWKCMLRRCWRNCRSSTRQVAWNSSLSLTATVFLLWPTKSALLLT